MCGRIIGYQLGIQRTFIFAHTLFTFYVDGVSVTTLSPRQHIWTFVTGYDEQSAQPSSTCPCVNGSTSRVQSFVGQNYFCESGLTQYPGTNGPFFSNGDPLWDGQGCGPTSSCCTFNSPPWFDVTLSSPTTDDIEVRICDNSSPQFGDSPIQLLELYVK